MPKLSNEKIFAMKFAKVYPLLIAKVEKKGRARKELDEAACWLTGYTPAQLDGFLSSELTYGDFFLRAPSPNPERLLIKGSICGIRVEEIQDPLMRDIRCLDKLADELAKGKPLDRILNRQ